ncbi:transcription antitermination factor NusB [Carboxydochorda subterranea]|uniref:Transcription antitermination protein NusB n=1 Tax=Carboxydichorda subterranea TaxID=3109565 RepID=A0ABZ1C0I2_9FIRM|nr:transcription antitermination factor NusB [Limnochorda sp. L945t]WRP18330.1 transcription antitermination factor NusB [Limnochorda sp. L945t]
MSRRLAREVALRVLFQVDVGKANWQAALERSLKEVPLSPVQQEFGRQLVEGVINHQQEIDRLISRFAIDWTLDRMANVDRNVMRIALFEILYLKDIPPSVSINEAVELAKKYGDQDSGKFVNGILGNVVRHVDHS